MPEAYAPLALDATIHIPYHKRSHIVISEVALAFAEQAVVRSVRERYVLQVALAALVAGGTLQRVIRQQETDNTLSPLLDLVRGRVHDHAFADGRGAGCHRLWHAFNRNKALPARADRGHMLVVTEERHVDALFEAGVEQQRPFWNADLPAVDAEGYHFYLFYVFGCRHNFLMGKAKVIGTSVLTDMTFVILPEFQNTGPDRNKRAFAQKAETLSVHIVAKL